MNNDNILIIPEAKDYDAALALFPEATAEEISTVAKKIAYSNAYAALREYRIKKNS